MGIMDEARKLIAARAEFVQREEEAEARERERRLPAPVPSWAEELRQQLLESKFATTAFFPCVGTGGSGRKTIFVHAKRGRGWIISRSDNEVAIEDSGKMWSHVDFVFNTGGPPARRGLPRKGGWAVYSEWSFADTESDFDYQTFATEAMAEILLGRGEKGKITLPFRRSTWDC
jgi:hypothetical protein